MLNYNDKNIKDEIIRRISYDPNTGTLTWNPRDNNNYFNKNKSGKEIICKPYFARGYWINRLTLKVMGVKMTKPRARYCWLIQTGDWPKNTVDHINRDSLDDRWDNLRDIPRAENNKNRGPKEGRRYKGYSIYGGRFHAKIFYRGQSFHLGVFDTDFEAAKAYDKKAYEIHGNPEYLNFPEDYRLTTPSESVIKIAQERRQTHDKLHRTRDI